MGEVKRPADHEKLEVEVREKVVYYEINDTPAPHLCLLFGLQQAIMCIGGVITIPYFITERMCIKNRDDVRAELLSIALVISGTATMLQDIIGVRLPIIQGGAAGNFAAIAAIFSLSKWKCPDSDEPLTDAEWKARMCELQGGLILASLTQVFLGCTGLMGVLMNFIGPLTIAPTISLIGLSLTSVSAGFNEKQWGVAAMSAIIVLLCSLYLGGLQIPLPAYSRLKGCHIIRYPILLLLPVLLAITITWLFCYILTEADVFPNNSTMVGYHARTDIRISVVDTAPWLYFPYPFQFGRPTFSVAGYVAFLAVTIVSIIESVGDYFACAGISGAPPPPSHAINRGIAIEGFSSIICGMLGAGHATTSYSGNIGAIGITKVASRTVFILAGIIIVLCGVIGKFGAVLTLIPEPIIGGILTLVFGMVAGVGISTLQFVDLKSSRNLTILGASLICGLMIPQWITANPDAVETGDETADQVIKVLLRTPMFVGGIIGFVLDNTAPGTLEQRGLLRWREQISSGEHLTEESKRIYDFPYIMKYIRRVDCLKYVPVCPTFDSWRSCFTCCSKDEESKQTVHVYEQTQENGSVDDFDGFKSTKL